MSKKIYIVEDNEKNTKLFITILRFIEDVEVFTETRGDLGLELIKSGEPDLIILDIQLPEMTGIEICSKLREIEKFKKTPIIAVTSFAMKGDRERIMAAGFSEYYPKPIKVAEFRDMVKNFLSITE
jgi:two-component system cell cycle response regulator DivK